MLGRMLRLAAEHNKLMRVPVLRKLKEAAPRAGFFLRLEPGMTKNDDGRLVYLTGELARLLTAHVVRVEALGRRMDPPRIIPYLFPHFAGGPRRLPTTSGAVIGEQWKEFQRAWETACTAAGCPGMLRHDFRRTAARNLERAGVPRPVAMKITGHHTEAVYRRYTITSDADQRAAAVRLGTFLGTSEGSPLESRPAKRKTIA